MNINLTDAYQLLSYEEKELVNLLTVKWSHTQKREIPRLLQEWLPLKITQANISKAIDSLIKKGFLENENNQVCVEFGFSFQLLPQLLIQQKYIKSATQFRDSWYSWNTNSDDKFREFMVAAFSDNTSPSVFYKIDYVTSHPYEFYHLFIPMLNIPEYHKVFRYNLTFSYNILRIIQRYSIQHFGFIEHLASFFEGERPFNGINYQREIQYAEIEFFRGNLAEAQKRIAPVENHDALLLKAMIALFYGNYDEMVKLFDLARTIGYDGTRKSKPTVYPEREFFYWLSFVFDSSKFKPEKAEAFINKLLKNESDGIEPLLSLLYFLKKDLDKANYYIGRFSLYEPSLILWFKLIVTFIVRGKIDKNEVVSAQNLLAVCQKNKFNLLIPDLVLMLEASGGKIPESVNENSLPSDSFKPLTSRIVKQEIWEMQLEGLAQLFSTPTKAAEKTEKSTRICFLVNFEKEIIQPILQTYSAKSGWTAGRNIAMKKLRLGDVEGMTDQDKRIAATISQHNNYYGSDTFDFNFQKAIVELCGHPLLFLLSNPSVSVELIKAEPEIYTEESGNKIALKTNIKVVSDSNVLLTKETQTRYKLITLSNKQKEIIQLIKKGISVPKSGKEKLMAVVSKLSGAVTVHSHLAEANADAKTIEADSKIRVQIVPMGDGLKAEMFVKPLGSEPPYLKPGKGGKMVYGTLAGEKCVAVRKMSIETASADTINNAIGSRLDVDLIEEAAYFNDPYDCLELLETIASHNDISVVEWPEGERFRIRKSVSFGQMHVSVKGAKQWFELDGELDIDEETILSIAELLKKNRESHGRFIELANGEFVALTEELKKQLNELESVVQIEKNKATINPFAAHTINDLSEKVASFKSDSRWKELQKKIKNADSLTVEIPATLEAELRSYQEEGFRWMARLNEWGAGACLADDMGLGKTVQAIAMLLRLAENGPTLVVCPASVASNWRNELLKFAPTLNPVMLKPGNRDQVFGALSPYDVLIVSYGLLQTEEENISKINWAMAILDEAHAIKNFQTKSSKAAMSISAGFKLVLTGTPVQNHLGELWNLFQFSNPGLLGTLQQFTNRYVKTEIAEQRNHLKKLIAPFILRRTKNKVLDELPAKTEITRTVELSKEEMAFYEALRRNAIATIESNNGPAGQQHIQALAEITKLRLACCNTELADKKVKLPSSKLAAFVEIIDELRANNHRALVFSQFVGHLNIVRAKLDEQKISYQYLDGSTPLPEREKAVKAFQSGKSDLFLISLKAGGLGLNLTAADYVIHLDPWWNPAIEDQASDRAHRMGQTRPVTIYRLVAHNTIEEKIVQLHHTKRNMADSLLEGSDQGAKLSTLELLEILKEVN